MSQVLFDQELFIRNCRALAEKNPALARALQATPDDAGIKVERARDGHLYVAIDGRQVLSQYAPLRDVERLIETEIKKEPARQDLVVFGFEVGHVVRGLINGVASRVRVVEPRLGVLRAAFGAVDLVDILSHARSFFVSAVDDLSFDVEYGVRMLPDLAVLALPGYQTAMPAELERLHHRIKELVTNRDILVASTLKNERLWFESLINNFPRYLHRPSIGKLQGAFVGRPAVVVAAGPSLDKNVRLLAQWKGRGVIVSVGTSLRKCVSLGLTPDVVMALESSNIMSQFRDLPEISQCYLALTLKAFPQLWDLPAKEIFTFSNFSFDSRWMLSLLNRKAGIIDASGSVACACFSLARLMGCNPIVLIGLDLAFGEAGQSHAAGIGTGGAENIGQEAYQQTLKEGCLLGDKLQAVDGYYGDKVVTKSNLRHYHLWFEDQIRRVAEEGIRVINCTEGGAKIKGAEQMPFAEATDQLLAGPLDVLGTIEALKTPENFSTVELRTALQDTRRQLRELNEQTRRGLEKTQETQRLLKRPQMPVARINQLVKEIDHQEQAIKTIVEDLEHVLSPVLNKDVIVVKSGFDYSGLNEAEALKLNMVHTVTMYNALIAAADYVSEKLGSLVDQLPE